MLRLGPDPQQPSPVTSHRAYAAQQGHAPAYDRLCGHLQQTSQEKRPPLSLRGVGSTLRGVVPYGTESSRRQNRYKSVVCEKDPYLLELIRYIHLNPLRAGIVKDLMELDKYPWCGPPASPEHSRWRAGHSAILGKRKNPLIPQPPKRPDRPNRFIPLNFYPVKS
jgi:hypothetical protein